MDLSYRLRKGQFHLLAYGLWLLLPLIPMASPWATSLGMAPNVAAWLPLFIGFVVAPLLHFIFPASLPSLSSNEKLDSAWRLYLDSLIIASVPLQMLMLLVSAKFWTSGQIDLIGSMAYLAGVGSFSGFCAINVGHELIHSHVITTDQIKSNGGFLLLSSSRGASISRLLGSLLLYSVCFGSFSAEHLKSHHLYVGTPKDCYTAKRAQSIYSFTFQTLAAYFRHSFSVKKQLLEPQATTLLSGSILFQTLASLVFLIMFFFAWRWSGLIFFLGQSIVAIVLMGWVVYLQHYGINRKQDSSGRIEPVREWHAWNEKSWIMDIYLLNLYRHADHHVNPNKPFYLLSESSIAPSYPYPFFIMMLLSLIPPLFYSVTHRVLDSHPILSKAQIPIGHLEK